jgi:poly-gamma-glutamate synthesis protein (capsule biosynthesis protein)
MNKRGSKNNHEKTGGIKKTNSYLKSGFLLIISLAIVAGLGFYLKSINNSAKAKNEADNQKEYVVKDMAELDKQEEAITKEPVKKTILLSFAGDFTLGTDTKFAYDTSLPAAFINSGKNYSYFMKNVSNIFSNDDYTLVNLETTFTDSNVKAPKDGEVFYNFKGSKEYVNILTKNSIDGVTIANNHIYDYGKQGMIDTVNVLKENNVDICGEGYKILRDIQGVKIGFLGYTGWEYSKDLKTKIVSDIIELRKQGAQVVIPYFHWGIERSYEPYDV